MNPNTRINETDRVFDGLMCVAVRFDVHVYEPTVTDDCSTGFDPAKKSDLNWYYCHFRMFSTTTKHHGITVGTDNLLRQPPFLHIIW